MSNKQEHEKTRAERIARLVDAAPPLSDAQRNLLACVLAFRDRPDA